MCVGILNLTISHVIILIGSEHCYLIVMPCKQSHYEIQKYLKLLVCQYNWSIGWTLFWPSINRRDGSNQYDVCKIDIKLDFYSAMVSWAWSKVRRRILWDISKKFFEHTKQPSTDLIYYNFSTFIYTIIS